jgi:hypothetical protein
VNGIDARGNEHLKPFARIYLENHCHRGMT